MPEHPVADHSGVSYERSDVNPRLVAVVMVTVAALVAVTVGALWLLFHYFDGRERRAKGTLPPLVAAEREQESSLPAREQLRRNADGRPILEGLPPEDPFHRVGPWHGGTAQFQVTRERAWLEGYDWVDREKGVVRVPLERAARMALADRAKYLPSRPKGDKP